MTEPALLERLDHILPQGLAFKALRQSLGENVVEAFLDD